jgi:predicted lipoprotein with Yx(FWY)xxD motif
MNRKLIVGGAGVVLAAGIGLAIATGSGGSATGGYGGSGTGGYGGTPSTTTPPGNGTAAATVTTAKTGLGQILVDGRARTLYLFEADPPARSTCDNACASVWPPLTTTGTPQAGGGALAGQLGVLHRGDGTTQITYHGHPLYLYAGDTQPRATNGQGLDQFGAEWYVLAPSGNKIDNGG